MLRGHSPELLQERLSPRFRIGAMQLGSERWAEQKRAVEELADVLFAALDDLGYTRVEMAACKSCTPDISEATAH